MPAPTRSTPVARAIGGDTRRRPRPHGRPPQQNPRRPRRRTRADWSRLVGIGFAGSLTVAVFAFLTAGRTPPTGVLAANTTLVAGTTASTALPVPAGRPARAVAGQQNVRPAGQQVAPQPALPQQAAPQPTLPQQVAPQPALPQTAPQTGQQAGPVPEAELVLDALPALPTGVLSRLPATGKDATAGRPGRPVTGPTGECRGGDTTRFANGEIPRSALCPLRGAAGHLLRADAAFAFNRLTQAYERQFGSPVCVTDSYRDRATQVRLRAQKPQLAAVPGTSRHGWGVATDLCGGIENFGSPPHTWMLRNAPRFGWQHPNWARADGTKPEPWHWEFTG